MALRVQFFRYRFGSFRTVKFEHQQSRNGVRDFFRVLGVSFECRLNDIPIFIEVRFEALMQQLSAEGLDEFLIRLALHLQRAVANAF